MTRPLHDLRQRATIFRLHFGADSDEYRAAQAEYERAMREQEVDEDMTMNAAMYSSASCDWETPQDFFDRINAEFQFTLDVCATTENAKCERFYSPDEDGLRQRWVGIVWMNPPYGREIGRWVEKAYAEAQNGAAVVCLLPARTDTRWFHDYCKRGEIRFVRGRLKFGGSTNNAPFPSMIVIFRRTDVGESDSQLRFALAAAAHEGE